MDTITLTTCLTLFKLDMGITHDLRDTLFSNLIETAEKEITKMGADLSSQTVEDIQLITDYALWQYRKRQEDIGLPRNIKFRIHNRVLQKASVSDGIT